MKILSRGFFSEKYFQAAPVMMIALLAMSCAPKEPVQFRSVRNIVVETDSLGNPVIKGEAVLFNPNRLRMKLKEIRMEVLVDGKKSAEVDQKPNLVIPSAGEFTVFVQARLSLKELGLLDTMMSLFGGKKYEIQYIGYIRVRVHGVTVRVPIKFTDQLRLKGF